jgi:membrane protease YdiL (CAAX protease family)
VPDWATFVGLTGVVLVLLLVLARLSYEPMSEDSGREHGLDVESDFEPRSEPESPETHLDGPVGPTRLEARELTTGELLANVVVSQGLFGGILLGAAVLTGIPAVALGVGPVAPQTLAVGTGLGVALYLTNEAGGTVAERTGITGGERLRETLAPSSVRGWILLLVVVLPVVAVFEELLFRAALVGAVTAGYSVSPWLMVGVSSVAFGLGHGAQGTGGMVVASVLGMVLGAAFVLTGSLLVVVIAHYLVNALEFVVHEAVRSGR